MECYLSYATWLNRMKLLILLCGFLPVLKAIDTKVYVQELNSQNFAVCHDKRKFSCPDSNRSLDLRIMSCGFSCAPGTSYVCKNDKKGRGVIEFCSVPEICAKGLMNDVYFDDNHQKVVVEKKVCPKEFYQPVRENCYTACTYFKHLDADLIKQLGIKVLYPGNNTDPGRGYCDVEHGFVSSNSDMYTSLAESEVSVCDKLVDFETLCPADKRLLPNRQCANICKKGYVVDKGNYFICSKGSGDYSSTVIEKTTAHQDLNSTLSPPGISIYKLVTNTFPPTTSHGQNDTDHWSTAVIVFLSVLTGLCTFALIACIVLCVRRRFMSGKKKNRKTGGKKIITKNTRCSYKNVNTTNGDIHIHMEGNTEDVIENGHGGTDSDTAENLDETEVKRLD